MDDAVRLHDVSDGHFRLAALGVGENDVFVVEAGGPCGTICGVASQGNVLRFARGSPKPDRSQRPLGIPTVLDRMIQQAVARVLGPLFEVDFSEHSHGYRPGRSAVECDLKLFFDTVNHDRLMRSLLGKVHCRKALGRIRRFLTAGVELPDGTREATPQGVPQGGPLSSLLANIVIDPLDKELECPGGLPPSSNRFPDEENADRMAGAERKAIP